MKTKLKQLIQTSLPLGSLVAAALLLGSATQTSLAVSADPSAGSSYTWNLQSSGSGQKGIAVVTFSNDLTFRGYQMLASVPPATNSSNPRGGSSDGRGGTGNSGKTNEFLFGFSPITGTWAMNQKSQIVGLFSVAINVTSEVTNYLAASIQETLTNLQTSQITNITVTFSPGQASITTNFAWATPPDYVQPYVLPNTNIVVSIGSAENTNSVSFTGTAVAGKRLSLLCSTTFGKVTYKGVPAAAGPDISGKWIGVKRANKQLFNEFFTLVPFTVDNPFPIDFPDIANFPNLYFTTNGIGPSYTFSGVVMLSGQKKVGFTFAKTGGGLSSTLGGIKANKRGISSTTKGIEDPLTRINFNAALVPTVP